MRDKRRVTRVFICFMVFMFTTLFYAFIFLFFMLGAFRANFDFSRGDSTGRGIRAGKSAPLESRCYTTVGRLVFYVPWLDWRLNLSASGGQQAAASSRGKAPRSKAAVIRQWEGSFFTCLSLIDGLILDEKNT